ncbi:MAG: hypothetical protein QOH41_998 [Blastocatellia bacterium]|jgi:hypothetical protein|nr:hypothetical protein [Blastocatellia bacterium]
MSDNNKDFGFLDGTVGNSKPAEQPSPQQGTPFKNFVPDQVLFLPAEPPKQEVSRHLTWTAIKEGWFNFEA